MRPDLGGAKPIEDCGSRETPFGTESTSRDLPGRGQRENGLDVDLEQPGELLRR